jgi:peptidyl-dipeptidase A
MMGLTGRENMDGSAVLEYFSPLQECFKQQNEGQNREWRAGAVSSKKS